MTTPKEIELHVGHFGDGTGAHGIVDEVKEATKITKRVYDILQANKVPSTYYKDTASKSQTENINRLIAHHNADTNGLIVSIHLNASAGTQSNGIGCEVCYTTQQSLATKLSAAIANAGGFKDRGAKYRNNIGVLVRTIEPAVLLEPFFVNSKEDVTLYNKHFEKICQAIAKALAEHIGYKIKDSSTTVAGNTETFYKKGAALGLYRVTKACSTYSGVDFTQADKLQSLKPGTAFTVTDIVKFGNKYRFKLRNGEYVSAKRSHLQKV